MYEYIKDAYIRHGRSERRAKQIAAQTVIARAQEHPEWGLARKGYYKNPEVVPQLKKAKEVFEGFHAYDMTHADEFKREITIAERMPYLGKCVWLTYRSDKWGDGTHDYIHTIESYPKVKIAVPNDPEYTKTIAIPKRVREAVTVSLIGLRADGFGFTDHDGHDQEAKFPRSSQWFWSPTGKALYCVQSKRTLLAVIWGGDLDVKPRGIVG